ncbi:MAG: sigma-70 family RNA polymerase sigma factor [Bacteroidota bacterium]
MDSPHDVTQLLQDMKDGNRAAVDALLPQVYEALQQLAHRQLQGERAGHTLNTTGLVHEAYLKLIGLEQISWQNRAHFFSMAAISMRRILVNHAHKRRALKRGGGQVAVTFQDDQVVGHLRDDDLIALDEALERLAAWNERQSKVVTYRFFGGLTHEEVAEVLGVSVPTVRRDWRMARAWLGQLLKDRPEADA